MDYMDIDGVFGNPASYMHSFGQDAERAVESAREQVSNLIGADPREIVWTSGATESDNLAIKGVAQFHSTRGKHIVTSAIEHKAVLDSCAHLETEGFEVTYIRPDREGIITPSLVEQALREDTILVSLMHVNNELGTITDIRTIGELVHEHGALFHVDAAQSVARLPLDMRVLKVDLLSLSGHKMYGPKGIGALYVGRRTQARVQPQLHGGGHEGGLRSGTVPTHQVVGMGEAARLLDNELDADRAHLEALTARLLERLQELRGVNLHGNRDLCVPGIINVGFAGVASEAMMIALNNIALSTGSACTSATVEPSHVLEAIGIPNEEAHSTLRISFGRFTSEEEIDYLAERFSDALEELRAIGTKEMTLHGA